MFTGIIQKTACVASVARHGGMLAVAVQKPASWKLAKGQSVAVDGVCSTVTRSAGGTFIVEYMPETLSKTTAGALKPGSVVNLERSLRLAGFVDGHLVLGHVDQRATVASVAACGDSLELGIELPRSLARFAAPLGSLALNGVSLTIARARGARVTLALIPFTLAHTNLDALRAGDAVNVEMDVVARYVLQGANRDTVGAYPFQGVPLERRHAKKKLRTKTARQKRRKI